MCMLIIITVVCMTEFNHVIKLCLVRCLFKLCVTFGIKRGEKKRKRQTHRETNHDTVMKEKKG